MWLGSQDKWYTIPSTGAQTREVPQAAGHRGEGRPRLRPLGKMTEKRAPWPERRAEFRQKQNHLERRSTFLLLIGFNYSFSH